MKSTKIIAIPQNREKVGHHTGCIRIFSENKIQLFYHASKNPSQVKNASGKKIPTYFFNCYEHAVREPSLCVSTEYGFKVA